MKKSALLLCTIALSCLAQEQSTNQILERKLTNADIQAHAQYWLTQLPELAPEDSALLANYLYFSFLTISAEGACRKSLIDLYTSSIYINGLAATQTDEARKIATNVINLCTNFNEELILAKTYSAQAYINCLKAIEQSENVTLKKIIGALQQYENAVVSNFIKHDRNQIDKNTHDSIKALNILCPKLTEIKELLTAVAANKNPYLKPERNPELTDLNTLISASDAILGCLNETSMNAVNLKMMSCDTLTIRKMVYGLLYAAYYDKTNVPVALMFDKEGMIEATHRTDCLPKLDSNFKLDKKYLVA